MPVLTAVLNTQSRRHLRNESRMVLGFLDVSADAGEYVALTQRFQGAGHLFAIV